MTGTVYLVGAGVGTVEYLTLKAFRLLKEADVVFYDRLIHDSVLAVIPGSTPRISVGKSPQGSRVSQEGIHELLVSAAYRYRSVVRLKGGDPFVFGRGGEELQALRMRGIDVEVVPGISSAFAAPLLAGIPVTTRQVASSVVVLNGHDCANWEWPYLIHTQATLVILMGMGSLEQIATGFLDRGKRGDTPCAIIERASYSSQRLMRAPLERLAPNCRREGLRNPAVIVIGEVARAF